MAFTVLSAAQGARLRNRISDTDTTAPQLADSVLDAIYTDAGLDLDLATVAGLQEMVGIYAMHVNIVGSSELNEQRGDRFKHLKDALAYWEQKTGTAGGPLQVGIIDLNIDTDNMDV